MWRAEQTQHVNLKQELSGLNEHEPASTFECGQFLQFSILGEAEA